jgi:hypothetical protein
MISVKVFQEQFSSLKEAESKLKEVEGGKDQLIEVNCLDIRFLFRRRILIEFFIIEPDHSS